MDELSVAQKTIEKFGVWAALPLLVAYMLYRYGMAGIALVPVWIDKIKSDAEVVRKRGDLEMELMNARHAQDCARHAQECAVVISTGEAVRVAVPNAIHEMQIAMSAAFEGVKAGHERIEAGHEQIKAGHERIEKKIDASHARIEQKLDSLTGPRRVPPPSPSVPS